MSIRSRVKFSLPSAITAIVAGLFALWFILRIASPSFAQLQFDDFSKQIAPGIIPPPPPSVTANPSSGTAPLSGVDITVNGGGSAGDTYNYSINCNHGDGIIDNSISQTSQSTYTVADLCSYNYPGTYTVLGDVTRYHTTDSGQSSVTQFALTTSVTVSAPAAPPAAPPPPPPGPTWMNPTQTPPGGNVLPPLDTGGLFTQKAGSLLLNNFLDVGEYIVARNLGLTGSGVQNALIVTSGRVGIKTANPDADFVVRGTTRLWGTSEPKQFNTSYTPTTDGLVVVSVDSGGGAKCQVSGGAGTEIVDGNTAQAAFSFPAIKGQPWSAGLVNLTSGTGSCFGSVTYYPFGVPEVAAGGAGTGGTTPPPPTSGTTIPPSTPGTFTVPPSVIQPPPSGTFTVPPPSSGPRVPPGGTLRF